MSEDRSELRQSLLPSLLEAVQYNVARSQNNVKLFEAGRVFKLGTAGNEDFIENEVIAGILTGDVTSANWNHKAEKVDFYVVKGILEEYFAQLDCLDRVRFEPLTDIEELHPGQTARILLDGEAIGLIGKVHPTVQKALDLQDTFVFELDVEPLLEANLQEAVIQSVAKYPSMTRDIAILAPTSLTHAELVDVIRANAGEFLSKVTLFDVYKGEHVPEGFQSLAYSLLFVNRNATLEEDVIKSAMTRVEEALVALENVSIR